MSDGEMPVGLNQLLRLVWLEETVALVRDENDRAAVERALDDRLASVLAVGSNTRRNSRAKTIIALLKIWRDGPGGGVRDTRKGLRSAQWTASQ